MSLQEHDSGRIITRLSSNYLANTFILVTNLTSISKNVTLYLIVFILILFVFIQTLLPLNIITYFYINVPTIISVIYLCGSTFISFIVNMTFANGPMIDPTLFEPNLNMTNQTKFKPCPDFGTFMVVFEQS